MTLDEKIQLIGQKMMLLSNNLEKYKTELDDLKLQLNVLVAEKTGSVIIPPVVEPVKEKPPVVAEEIKVPVSEESQPIIPEIKTAPVTETFTPPVQKIIPKQKINNTSFEEKVGGRWLSIVGIIVLVLGIAIGVKYAIDQDLINETTRLVLGYLAGAIIMGFAMVYKKKYELFSAILLSGAMAVMYFTTYVGYAFYHFYPAGVAFLIMTVFTGFTVFSAHIYNREIIALIGLVGGYAVPPLLSTGSGEVEYMFGFMLILNLGILILSFVKYWKFVNHVAYGLTWLIFAGWMGSSYNAETYFTRAMVFSTLFYLIFYASFISYKIIRNKQFTPWDVVLVMSNSFIYFGLGYNALNHEGYDRYQGLFCVLNAAIHLGFAFYCKNKGVSDKSLFHFIIAMVITFITIAIPVQLNGNYVTFTWLSELIILFWLAKRYGISNYRNLGYILAVLSFCSLVHDWTEYDDIKRYAGEYHFKPLFNEFFVTGICGIAAYFAAWRLHKDQVEKMLSKIAQVTLLVFGTLTAYITFANEINLFFDIKYYGSEIMRTGDYGDTWKDFDHSWKTYETLWMMMYTCFFISVIGYLNLVRLKNKVVAYITWSFNTLFFIIGIWGGSEELGRLRDSAINYDSYTDISTWNYNFRYVYLIALVVLLFMTYAYRNSELLAKVKRANTWLFHIFILAILSSELTNIMMVTHLDNIYHYQKVAQRMGFTILWGLYSMALITYGILRKKKLLRIVALSLFGATVLKLAANALSMSKGYQLIVFISIGIILLTVSFMYQKFKHLLFDEDNSNETDQTEELTNETEGEISPDPIP